MRFTQGSACAFLFVFFYGYIILGINRDHHPAMMGLVLLALTLTAGVILICIAFRDPHKPKVPVSRSLLASVILFLCFLLRLWTYSSYHPLPHHELWALAAATIAAIAESFRTESDQTSGSKK